MKVATFLFEITSHSHFLTLNALSGTAICISSFTLTWQPSLQLLVICFLLKKPTSVGRIVPPPDITRHLHCPQLPLPPQADGRKIFSAANVASNEEPGVTSTTFEPSFMFIFTVPLGVSLAFAKSNNPTSIRVTTKKATTEIIII